MATRISASKAKAKQPDDASELPEFSGGEDFDALSAADKEKVFNYYSTHRNLKTYPLSKAERERLRAGQKADRKKMGRPVVGEGSHQISVTIESGLLRQVDEYARTHGLKRAQMIAQGLRVLIGKPRKSA